MRGGHPARSKKCLRQAHQVEVGGLPPEARTINRTSLEKNVPFSGGGGAAHTVMSDERSASVSLSVMGPNARGSGDHQ